MESISKVIAFSLLAWLFLGMQLTTQAQGVQNIKFKGTVKYINLEGGFWGIISEDGKKYDPINLEEKFKVAELPVQIEARIVPSPSIHMWGTIIEITTINQIE